MKSNALAFFSDLKVINNQKRAFTLAFGSSLITINIDFFVATNMGAVIDGVVNIFSAKSVGEVPTTLLELD